MDGDKKPHQNLSLSKSKSLFEPVLPPPKLPPPPPPFVGMGMNEGFGGPPPTLGTRHDAGFSAALPSNVGIRHDMGYRGSMHSFNGYGLQGGQYESNLALPPVSPLQVF